MELAARPLLEGAKLKCAIKPRPSRVSSDLVAEVCNWFKVVNIHDEFLDSFEHDTRRYLQWQEYLCADLGTCSNL
jgi:hypothetical protein